MSSIALPQQNRTVFDHWRSLSVAVYMTLIGYGVVVGVPVISTAWVELLGFSEEQVGRVAGADLGGLAFGSIIVSAAMARWNRRYLALMGLITTVCANLLCMNFQDYQSVLWLRFMAGTGAGIYTAVAVATLGGSSRPARAYNMMLFAFAFSQAGELRLLPLLSMNGIYLTFIIAYLISLPFLRWIPSHALPGKQKPIDVIEHHQPETRRRVPTYLPWLCLSAIFLTNINIGAYWTYIELASLDAGLDADWIGWLLVIVSLGSFLGCLIAVLISDRWGLGRPLLLTLLSMAVIVGILGFEIDYTEVLISLGAFNLLWIFIDVYQMSTIAVIDKSGAYASMLPAAQGLGQITGPNIAASIIGAGLGYHSVFFMCAGAALAGMFVYWIMYFWLKRTVPALAEAS